MTLQCLMESVSSVSQSASRYEEAHIAVFACFELGMMKAQSAQNTTVSVSAGLCSMSYCSGNSVSARALLSIGGCWSYTWQ